MGRHDLDQVNCRMDAAQKIAALEKNMHPSKGRAELTAMGNRIERILHEAKKHGGPMTLDEGRRAISRACQESPAIRRQVMACYPDRRGQPLAPRKKGDRLPRGLFE